MTTYLKDATIAVPDTCQGTQTYIGMELFTSGVFDAGLCAAACSTRNLAISASTKDTRTCQFFTTFMLYKNGISVGQYCSLYTTAWPSRYATNEGYSVENDKFTVGFSYSFENATDPGSLGQTCSTSGGFVKPSLSITTNKPSASKSRSSSSPLRSSTTSNTKSSTRSAIATAATASSSSYNRSLSTSYTSSLGHTTFKSSLSVGTTQNPSNPSLSSTTAKIRSSSISKSRSSSTTIYLTPSTLATRTSISTFTSSSMSDTRTTSSRSRTSSSIFSSSTLSTNTSKSSTSNLSISTSSIPRVYSTTSPSAVDQISTSHSTVSASLYSLSGVVSLGNTTVASLTSASPTSSGMSSFSSIPTIASNDTNLPPLATSVPDLDGACSSGPSASQVSKVIPTTVNGTDITIGYIASDDNAISFTIKRPGFDQAVFANTGSQLTMKNATIGDFGLDANGTLFWTSPDCSYTASLPSAQDVTSSNKVTSLRRREVAPRSVTYATSRSRVNVDFTILEESDESTTPNSCPLELALSCKDLVTGLPGEPIFNQLSASRWVGSCPYGASGVFEPCSNNLQALSSVADFFGDFQGAYETIAGVTAKEGAAAFCAGVLVRNPELITQPHLAVAFTASCYLAVTYLEQMAIDKAGAAAFSITNLNIGTFCSFVARQNYEIALVAPALPSPTLFATTLVIANPLDIATAVRVAPPTTSGSCTPTASPRIGPCDVLNPVWDRDGPWYRIYPNLPGADCVEAPYGRCSDRWHLAVVAMDACLEACSDCNELDGSCDACRNACDDMYSAAALAYRECMDAAYAHSIQCWVDYPDMCYIGSAQSCLATYGDLCQGTGSASVSR